MVEAFTSVPSKLEIIGHKLKLHVLDNEGSLAIYKVSRSQKYCKKKHRGEPSNYQCS